MKILSVENIYRLREKKTINIYLQNSLKKLMNDENKLKIG